MVRRVACQRGAIPKNPERSCHMKESQYDNVCSRTERKDERVRLRNTRTGQFGHTFGCTMEGATVQVQLESGELDSWPKDECEEAS
jgi:hypothetical protein